MKRAPRTWAARSIPAVSAVLLATGCQERLTAPVDCPTLCPGGGTSEVFDTVLTPVPDADSSFAGYVEGGSGIALLVSNGLPASESRAAYRFSPRQDSVVVDSVNRGYLVDSVVIAVNLVARDTLVDGLKVYLYRISNSVQAGVTFDEIEAQLVETNLIDSVAVADTVNAGPVQLTLRGAEVLKTGLPVDSGGTLSIGLAIAAAAPTGIRVGSLAGGNGASFVSYVTAQNVADTVTGRTQSLLRPAAFNTFASRSTLVPDPDLLAVGGEPASRSLVRFALPDRLDDSASIVRATLELTPARPILGLPTDPALLVAKPVLADLGAKSPVASAEQTAFWATDTLTPGIGGTVSLDVTNMVRLWQSTSPERPEALFLSLLPEAATFMRGEFGSTRSPAVSEPRLRITYMLQFPFERP